MEGFSINNVLLDLKSILEILSKLLYHSLFRLRVTPIIFFH